MKNKKIELKIVYEGMIDDVFQEGWIEINGEKVKYSGHIGMGTTLDILEHLGYSVELIFTDVDKEIKKL